MIVVTTKSNIPIPISFVNTKSASVVARFVKFGVAIARAKKAAERLPMTADNALRKANFVLVTKIF